MKALQRRFHPSNYSTSRTSCTRRAGEGLRELADDSACRLDARSRWWDNQAETMSKQDSRARTLIDKLKALPPDKAAEVEDFIDFLAERDDRRLTQAAGRLSEKALQEVWDNADDAAYDRV